MTSEANSDQPDHEDQMDEGLVQGETSTTSNKPQQFPFLKPIDMDPH